MLRDLLAPWRRASTWWALTHIATGVVVGAITFSVTIALLATSAGLLIVLPLAVPVVWLLFVSSRILAAVERSRLAALLGLELDDPVPPLAGRSWWQRWKERTRTRARWKEIAHHLLLLPLGVGGFVLTVAAWCGSAALVGLPFYIYALPERSAKFGLFVLDPGAIPVLLALVGVIGIVFLAPWVTVGFGLLDGLAARALLGPSRKRDLRAQVTSSRAAAAPPSTVPKPSASASSVIFTTAPSSGWCRSRWISARLASGSRPIPKLPTRSSSTPTRTPRRR